MTDLPSNVRWQLWIVAFGFAYFRFPGRGLLFGLVLATMMLPGAVTMIPIYLIWKETGLLGTWVPLWGMNLFGSAFYIFLQRQFFLGLPRELFEAAYGKPGTAVMIALDACEAVADTRLTLADLRRADQWRLEYVSLRNDGQGEFLSVGEMPV